MAGVCRGSRTVIAGVLPALLLASCAPKVVRQIEITSLGNIAVERISSQGTVLGVDLTLHNAYSRLVQVKNLNCEFALAGEFLGKGAIPASTQVAPLSSATVKLPFTIEPGKFTEADFDALFQAEIPYRLRGSAELELPVHAPVIALEASGAIPRPDRIHIGFAGATAGSFFTVKGVRPRLPGVAGVEGTLGVQVENPFAFPVVVQRFDYKVTANGIVTGEGALAGAVRLAAGGNQVDVPVLVHPVDTMKAVAQSALALRQPDIRLNATLVIRRNNRDLEISIDQARTPGETGR